MKPSQPPHTHKFLGFVEHRCCSLDSELKHKRSIPTCTIALKTMSVSPHGLADSGATFPTSTVVLDVGQKKPWHSPTNWSSSTKPAILPKNESVLPSSDMVPALLHSQDERFLGGDTSKLPCDLLQYDSDSGPSSFRTGPSELGKEDCPQGSRPLGESFHLGGSLPAVFSSLDMFKPLSSKETDLGCFQNQSFGSPLKGSKCTSAQKLGHAVAFESDFQHFSSHLQSAGGVNSPSDGGPSPLRRSENSLLPKGLISPPGGICRSNLSRHRSSPASLLSQLAVDAQEIAGSNGEINTAQISGPFMQASTISAGALTEDSHFTGVAGAAPEYTAETDGGEWDGSTMSHGSSFMSMLDDISPRRKEYGDIGANQTIDGFGLDTQGKASEATTGALTRHLSLPVVYNKQSEPVSGDNWVQDSVPCRLRAKRGCATHPRSIAERVRRTRISERMRKLQELVPNMEKQTNISDMLDEAIEYVKFLQSEVKEVSQKRSSCQGLCKLDKNSKEPS